MGARPMPARSAVSGCKHDQFDEAAVARFYAALGRLDARVGNGSWFGEEPRVFRLGFGLLPIAELERRSTR